jgi:hypothetical protein
MTYKAKFRLGKYGKEQIKDYKTVREATQAVAAFTSRHGQRGYAEYLGKSGRKRDRSTIKVLLARRNQDGVLVIADYHEPRTGEGVKRYRVELWIDPCTQEILSTQFSLLGRKRQGLEIANAQEIAREIRDLFLELPAWSVLKTREIDWFTAVSSQGKTIQLLKRPTRRASAKPAAH